MLDDLKNFIDSKMKENFDNFSNKSYMALNLQKINEKFITEYKIVINHNNRNLTIIPIETEIYFSKVLSEKPDDGMCHMNDLQKGKDKNGNDRFGKLYFHRYHQKNKNDDTNTIKCTRGGVDVCISNSENYYLSILIRSAFINGTEKENLCSGINNICKEILEFYKPTKCLQCFFKELEVELVLERRIKEKIDTTNLFEQPRISDKEYSRKNKENLNCLNLGNKDKDCEYLNIINKKQTFYKKYNTLKKLKEYKERFNQN